MSTEFSPDEREILRRLDTSMATEFLNERLAAVESLIREREAYLDEVYPEGRPRQSGEEDVTEVYRQEQRILEGLLAKVGTDLFAALQHRLERAQERVQDFAGSAEWPIRSAAGRRRHLAALTEERILTDLVRQWIAWLKEGRTREVQDRRRE